MSLKHGTRLVSVGLLREYPGHLRNIHPEPV